MADVGGRAGTGMEWGMGKHTIMTELNEMDGGELPEEFFDFNSSHSIS
jgi:hypothetical protein